MYRNLVTAMLLSLLSYQGLAQQTPSLADLEKVESHEVKNWIAQNPGVKLIPLEHFESISQLEREELVNTSSRLLHNNATPTLSEIEAFIASGYIQGELDILLINEELTFVEDWLTQNPHVKIVTMEEFSQLNSEMRNEILQSEQLIICDEKLTKDDITAYESN